jgi:2-methylisocitrate lyase-like PEP mutase family enzyme
MLKGVTVAQLVEVGVKRISIGGALSRAALTALLRAGTEMRDQGSFGWTSDLASGTDVNKLLGT